MTGKKRGTEVGKQKTNKGERGTGKKKEGGGCCRSSVIERLKEKILDRQSGKNRKEWGVN